MSLGLCVLVRDRQDSICVRFARAGLFCAGSPFLCRIAGPAAFCQVRRILFFPFFRVFRLIMSVVRRGRGTRRACRTLQFDQGSDRCAWCLSMGANAPAVCTFKARGRQEMFKGTACVRRACFGHMVAFVWDGSPSTCAKLLRIQRNQAHVGWGTPCADVETGSSAGLCMGLCLEH